jgi:CopA family copper-resistance protein
MSIKFTQGLLAGIGIVSSSFAFAAVKEYHLYIDEAIVNLTGKPVKRITVNGQFPAPSLAFQEGDDAVIHVHNQLKNQDSSIHWHGLLLPGIMDGVPGFNGFNGIKPQSHFTYKFKVRQNGTYWYHAHSKGQEQDGLYGPLVIYPKDKKPLSTSEMTERDYVVMLSDFHEKTSDQIQKNLKISAEYYQNQRETLGDVWKQVQRDGLKATWSDRKMWNQMRMLKTDLSDVTGYTFLINGKTPEQNWAGQFKPNEKVRLRFINASAMSFFDVRIPHLKMTVVSADGQPVQPVSVDEFRIGTAETYDVVVEPQKAAYQIEAESIDRSGFAIGTLHNEFTTKPSIQSPQARPRAILNMADMGHAEMHGMNHSNMQHSDTPNVDHAKMNHGDMHEMDHSHDQNMASKTSNPVVEGWANASTPKGDKALQYSDLKSLTPQPDTREASSELVIRLGGTMERYIWTINGQKFSDAQPLKVKYGERIRIKFINDSMMAHPMHLHGMFMQLENGQPAVDMPNKHTIIVPPAKTVTALLTADELGEWAIHCHLLYHMSAGMMNKLIVANVTEGQTSTTPLQKTKVSTAESHEAVQQGDQHAHH